MVRRSQGCRPVRSAVVRRAGQARKERDVAPKENTVEKIAKTISEIPKHVLEYQKMAINFMFLANGGGTTAILFNFDIYKYLQPLVFFSYGVFISIISTMYLGYCSSLAIKIFKNKSSNQIKHSFILFEIIKYTLKFLRVMRTLIFLSPSFFFFLGVFSMEYIIEMKKAPTLYELLQRIWQQSLQLLQ